MSEEPNNIPQPSDPLDNDTQLEPQEQAQNLGEDLALGANQENNAADSHEGFKLNPAAFQHPIFKWEEDELLWFIMNCLRPHITPTKELEGVTAAFGDLVYQLIFKNKQIPEIAQDFLQLGFSAKRECLKEIKAGEVCFRCLDCELNKNQNFYFVICAECFEKSNHPNHRVIFLSQAEISGLSCICGDTTVFKAEGTCPEHNKPKMTTEEILSKFPKEIFESSEKVLTKAMYGIISVYEIANSVQNEPYYDSVLNLAKGLLSQIFKLSQTLNFQVSSCFYVIFQKFFQFQLKEPFNLLWHNCEDLSGESTHYQADTVQSTVCKCTILGNILRLGKEAETGETLELNSPLAQCMKEEFQAFFIEEFARYTKFLFPQAFKENSQILDGNSKLLNWNNFLWSEEKLFNKALENGYIEGYLEIMKVLIKNYSELTPGFIDTLSFLGDSWVFLFNSMNPEVSPSCLKKMIELNVLPTLIEQSQIFQLKHIFQRSKLFFGVFDHEIDYDFFANLSQMTKSIDLGLEHGFRLLTCSPSEEKPQLLKELANDWFTHFQKVQSVIRGDLKKEVLNINPSIERIFLLFLKTYNQELTQDNLQNFLNDNFDEEQKAYLAQNLAPSLLETLGIMRFMQIVHHPDTGPLLSSYFNLNWLFFEYDIVLIQLMCLSIPSQNLFETVATHLFSYDDMIQNNYKDPISFNKDPNHQKQRILVLQDFLNFLVFLMNDEISLLNLKQCEGEVRSGLGGNETIEPEFDPHSENVTEKVICNILLSQYWTDTSHVKNLLLSVFFNSKQADEIISKVTIYNEKSHKIRIKDGYESDFDPYLFYRVPSIQHDLINEVTTKDVKTKKIDLVSGKYYQDRPKHLTTLQRKFYQSSLPDYLSSLIKQNFTKETTPYLIRYLLRLVLLNLQVVEEAWAEPDNSVENEGLRKKVEENYMSEEFRNSLIALSKESSLEDCKPCIKNIQNLLLTLASTFQQDPSLLEELAFVKKPSYQEDKKKLAQEKMEKLKQEFTKKQALFAEKQKELSPTKEVETEELNLPSEAENTELVCQYCLERIDKVRDEYGVPIYVAFTNNFYDTNESNVTFKEIDYGNLSNESWWPVVSSCNHHYHKNCFDIHLSTEHHAVKEFLHNMFETYCSLCKTLCNNFLCLNKGEASEKKIPSEEELVMHPQLYWSFGQKIQGAQYYHKFSLQLLCSTESQEPYLPIPLLFERAYTYFLEGFYLHEDLETKRNVFDLYVNFFRNLILDFHQKDVIKPFSPFEFFKVDLYPPEQLLKLFIETQIETCIPAYFSYEVMSLAKAKIKPTPEYLAQKHLPIIRVYLMFVIHQCLSYDKITQAYPGSFEEQFSLLCSDSTPIINRILAEFAFPIQKIMLAMALNLSIFFKESVLANNFYKLISAPELSLENIDKLFKLIALPIKFKEFVDSYVILGLKSGMEQGILYNKVIKPGLDSFNTNLQISRSKIKKLAPRIIKLPPTYAEYNNTYLRKKCILCNKFCNHMYTYMCFICGDIFCQGYCPSIHEPPEKLTEPCTKCNGQCPPRHEIVGNLNRHAAKYHMGAGLFLDIFQPFTNVIDPPLNAISPSKNIYIDKLGQPIQLCLVDTIELKKIDFKKFTLNPEFIAEIEDIIKHHNTGKECFKVLIDYPPEDQIPPPAEL